MCGLVFAGSNSMGLRDVDFFETLLYMDVIRGDHSTGVFAGYYDYQTRELSVPIRKAAVAADVYIRRPDMWGEIKQLKTPSAHNPKTYTVKYPKFLVGHNRYATMGEVVDRNAHPFQHGAVTLVHNGTLDNQSLLPDHQKFAVDSENICYAIDKLGIDETIKILNGKFTLIWHDARDNTLNFIRNKDRPFHFMETSTGDWFGASEEDMLMWLSDRPKGISAKRHFEAEVGVQYVFDVSNGQFKFKEERKHELPVFPYKYAGYYTRGNSAWDDDDYDGYWERFHRSGDQSSTTRSTSTGSNTSIQSQAGKESAQADQKARINGMLAEHGVKVKVGDRLFFDAFQFERFAGSSEQTRGKMTGYLNGISEYVEVQAPGVQESLYREEGEYSGRVVSAYVMNYILHIVVGEVQERFTKIPDNVITLGDMVNKIGCIDLDAEDEEEDAIMRTGPSRTTIPERDAITEEDEEEAVSAVTASGDIVTKKEWERNGSLNCCANCGSPIPFADAEDAHIVTGSSFCKDCYDDVDDAGYPKDSGSDRPMQFKCVVCGNRMHDDLMSSVDDVCIMCSKQHQMITAPEPKLPVKPKTEVSNTLVLRHQLPNGMKVTRALWNKMNTCWYCKGSIPFDEIPDIGMMGGRVLCPDCNVALESTDTKKILLPKR